MQCAYLCHGRKRQAKEHKWNDALICNTAGDVIESTIANIFWVSNGVVYTPPL